MKDNKILEFNKGDDNLKKIRKIKNKIKFKIKTYSPTIIDTAIKAATFTTTSILVYKIFNKR